MKTLLYAALLLSLPSAVAASFHLTSDSADMTLEMSQDPSEPVTFNIIGNGPAIDGMPGVCEVSGKATFWAGTHSGTAWIYLSPDKKTMVLIKGRSDFGIENGIRLRISDSIQFS